VLRSFTVLLARYYYNNFMALHIARMEEKKNVYVILIEKLDGNRKMGNPRRRWDDNIKMNFKDTEYEVEDWIYLAQGRGASDEL
jgi:hypothetical protein